MLSTPSIQLSRGKQMRKKYQIEKLHEISLLKQK